MLIINFNLILDTISGPVLHCTEKVSDFTVFNYYSGTRLESKLLVFFGFSVCSHVYLLNYRSELAQIWRQDTDTIHDHNHTKKIISMQVRSAIMGRNGRVVLGA